MLQMKCFGLLSILVMSTGGPSGFSKVKPVWKAEGNGSQAGRPVGWHLPPRPQALAGSRVRSTRGAPLQGSGGARGVPFAACVIGREKHKYLVQTLGSGKFSNLSGNVSLSPFYIFFFPQQEKTFHLDSFRCRCVKTLGATSQGLSIFY